MRYARCLLIAICMGTAVYAQSPKVEKVEPPTWWANHTINPVHLLVPGTNLRDAIVTSNDHSLAVSNVRVNIRATYLFFDVAIPAKDKPQADKYLKFLVGQLKTFIDKDFSTKKGRENAFAMGSSMGGLISIYAICDYPRVFGGAVGISTHLPMVLDAKTPGIETVSASFRTYLEKHLPKAITRKIYFDYGDQTLDAYYPPLQKKVDEIMRARGFTEKSWVTRSFPVENHSEISWAKRLNIPFEFLLGK